MNRSELLRKVAHVRRDELFVPEQGTEYEFDIPPEIVPEVNEKFERFIRGEVDKKEFVEFLVRKLHSLELRTVEMVFRVSEKTGIRFPHVFQMYVEFFLLTALNPCKYRVIESTRRRVAMNVEGCPVDGMCDINCQGVFEEIALKTRFSLEIEVIQKNRVCVVSFKAPW